MLFLSSQPRAGVCSWGQFSPPQEKAGNVETFLAVMTVLMEGCSWCPVGRDAAGHHVIPRQSHSKHGPGPKVPVSGSLLWSSSNPGVLGSTGMPLRREEAGWGQPAPGRGETQDCGERTARRRPVCAHLLSEQICRPWHVPEAVTELNRRHWSHLMDEMRCKQVNKMRRSLSSVKNAWRK